MKKSFIALCLASTALISSCDNPAPKPKKTVEKAPEKQELTMLEKQQIQVKKDRELKAIAEKKAEAEEKLAYEERAKKARDAARVASQKRRAAEEAAREIARKKANTPEAIAFRKVNPFLGKMLPHLKNYNGSDYNMSDAIAGGPIMVYYSASWCGPCRAVTPQLVQQFSKFKQLGLNLVLAGADRDQTAMVNYMKHYKMPWPGISKEYQGNSGVNNFGGRGIPHIALLTADGKLIAKGHPKDLSEMLAKLPRK